MIWYEKTKHKENKAEHYLYLVPAGALEVTKCVIAKPGPAF